MCLRPWVATTFKISPNGGGGVDKMETQKAGSMRVEMCDLFCLRRMGGVWKQEKEAKIHTTAGIERKRNQNQGRKERPCCTATHDAYESERHAQGTGREAQKGHTLRPHTTTVWCKRETTYTSCGAPGVSACCGEPIGGVVTSCSLCIPASTSPTGWCRAPSKGSCRYTEEEE